MIFGFIYCIYSTYITPELLYSVPAKTEHCSPSSSSSSSSRNSSQMLQPLARQTGPNTLSCSVFCVQLVEERLPVCGSHQESFLELLHWKSTGPWLCGLMLHLCLLGIAVSAVQGSRLEMDCNSFLARLRLSAGLQTAVWTFAISFFFPSLYDEHTCHCSMETVAGFTSKHLF